MTAPPQPEAPAAAAPPKETTAAAKGRNGRKNGEAPPAHLRGPLVYLDPDEAVLVDDPHAALYDERVELPVDPAAVANFRSYGVILPCVGRRDGDTVVIIDGKQRVKIAREANRINRTCGLPPLRLPVVLRTDDDKEAAAVAESANAIRWGDSPLVKARKVQRLVNLGHQQKDIAGIFGASKSTVSIWLSLLRLTPRLQAMLEREELRFADAVRLAKLPRDEQEAKLEGLDADRATPRPPPPERPGPPGESPPAPASVAGGEEELLAVGSQRDEGRPERVHHRQKLRDLVRFVVDTPDALPLEFNVILLWLMDEAPDSALVERFPRLNGLIGGG